MAEALKQTKACVLDAMSNQLRLEFLQRVKNEAVIREGQVDSELLKLAKESNIGLLVIGSRGLRGLDRLLHGSVAEKVFRQASCPVLIVPPTAIEQSGIPVRTILYSTSFSENSLRVLPYAFSLARIHRARLILLHVLSDSAIHSQDDMARLRASAGERLRQLLPAKEVLAPDPLPSVEFGPVEQRIVRVAVENHADLIVLGIAGGGAAVAHLPEGLTYKLVGDGCVWPEKLHSTIARESRASRREVDSARHIRPGTLYKRGRTFGPYFLLKESTKEGSTELSVSK